MWRARTPPSRLRWSWRNTRGTSVRQSSCERPRPLEIDCQCFVRWRWGKEPFKTYLFGCHRLLRRLVQLLNSLLVKSQILLATHEDDWQALAEVQHFGDPLLHAWTISFMYQMCQGSAQLGHVSRQRTFSCTLSSESGESTAKQMRMTCESGYERGRRRS